MDLISVIIPAYNAEKFLGRCIESVVRQTYKELEIIIIDDGSEDQTLFIAKKYAENDSRIRVYHQSNQGVSKTRNRGIGEAVGKYIQFIDADDFISNDMIQVLYTGYENSDIDVSICSYILWEGNAKRISAEVVNMSVLDKEQAWQQLFYRKSYQGFSCNKLFKSEIIKKYNIQFAEDIAICEDILFCSEYFSYIKKAVYCPVPLYFYDVREGSATTWTCLNKKRYSTLEAYERMEQILQGRSPETVSRAMYDHLATDCILLMKMTVKYRQKYMRKILSYIKRTGWYYLKSDWQIKFKLVYIPLKLISYISR